MDKTEDPPPPSGDPMLQTFANQICEQYEREKATFYSPISTHVNVLLHVAPTITYFHLGSVQF